MRFSNINFGSYGASSFSRPVFIFALLSLTLSLVWNSLILAGCTTSTPTIRNWYLVSFKYNTDSEFYKKMQQFYEAKDKVNDVKNQVKETINNTTDTIQQTVDDLNPFNKRDDSSEPSFNEIRVGYRALCIETTHGWDCARSSDKLATQDISQDPLQLVDIAGIYKDKIIWSLPFWVTVTCTGLAYLMVFANAIPIPCLYISPVTKKVAAGALAIASVSALGAMVLSGVISSSVSTIVDKVTLDAIEVHNGRMVLVFGWTVFSLVTASFIGVFAVVVAEWGVNKVAAAVEEHAEKGMTAAGFGRNEREGINSRLDAIKKGHGLKGLQNGFSFAHSLRK